MNGLRSDVDAKFEAMDKKFDTKLSTMESKFDVKFSKVDENFAKVFEKIHDLKVWNLTYVGLGLLVIMARGFHWI
jgi:hypothetical protein